MKKMWRHMKKAMAILEMSSKTTVKFDQETMDFVENLVSKQGKAANKAAKISSFTAAFANVVGMCCTIFAIYDKRYKGKKIVKDEVELRVMRQKVEVLEAHDSYAPFHCLFHYLAPYKSRNTGFEIQVARIQVSKSLFGAGAYSYILEAKASAAKVNASFRYVDFPYQSSPDHYDPSANVDEPESPSTSGNQQSDAVNSAVAGRATEGLRSFATENPLNELRLWRESCSVALTRMFDDNVQAVFQ